MTILVADIIAHDDSHIVKFQPLRCMDAACFIDGILTDRKRLSVIKVPAYAEVSNLYIMKAAVLSVFLRSVPTVTGQDPRAVSCPVFFNNYPLYICRVIAEPDLIIKTVQLIIRCFTDLQKIVDPRKITV